MHARGHGPASAPADRRSRVERVSPVDASAAAWLRPRLLGTMCLGLVSWVSWLALDVVTHAAAGFRLRSLGFELRLDFRGNLRDVLVGELQRLVFGRSSATRRLFGISMRCRDGSLRGFDLFDADDRRGTRGGPVVSLRSYVQMTARVA